VTIFQLREAGVSEGGSVLAAWGVALSHRSAAAQRRLAVEADGIRFHRGSVAFEDDHARDLDLRSRGFEVRRQTERQVGDSPAQVAADLREALSPAPLAPASDS
jgi:Protein of unknown function (DUF559)